MLAEIDWFLVIGPIVVFVILEIVSGGVGVDGFGLCNIIYGGVLVSTLCWKVESQVVVEIYFKSSKTYNC